MHLLATLNIFRAKENKNFIEKYYYMDWSMFLDLNNSSTFLQFLSMANFLSPLISLLIPILFLFFPFLILKLQGLSITFEMYIEVLKDTVYHHIIGKTIQNCQCLSWDKIIYLMVTFVLYIIQFYQNINVCHRYYNNMKVMNKNLHFVRDYIIRTTKRMDLFILLHGNRSKYIDFCMDMKVHSYNLKLKVQIALPIVLFFSCLSFF